MLVFYILSIALLLCALSSAMIGFLLFKLITKRNVDNLYPLPDDYKKLKPFTQDPVDPKSPVAQLQKKKPTKSRVMHFHSPQEVQERKDKEAMDEELKSWQERETTGQSGPYVM